MPYLNYNLETGLIDSYSNIPIESDTHGILYVEEVDPKIKFYKVEQGRLVRLSRESTVVFKIKINEEISIPIDEPCMVRISGNKLIRWLNFKNPDTLDFSSEEAGRFTLQIRRPNKLPQFMEVVVES